MAGSSSTGKCWGYARVSTLDQTKGESLSVQQSKIEAIAKAQGCGLAGIFVEEGVSGGKPLSTRPEGSKLLAACRKGDTVIALKLDRAFRNTQDALDTAALLEKRGVRLYLADIGWIVGDAAGALHLTMMAGFATFERARIGERISESRQSLKARQRYAGGSVQFGYRLVPSASGETTKHGALVHHLEPEETIHAIARDLLAKGYSTRLAAGHFKAHGIETTHNAVAKLFRELRQG